MTGLAMAAKDADEADDNMSTSPEEDEQEKLELAWKRIVNRLKYYPAKAHSKIRQAVVEGIAAARKAHLPIVVGQLREALLQFHPEAAGACKSSALEVLIEHGDYDDTDDLDDEELEGEEEEELNVQIDVVEGETAISSALCAEAIVMLGSLDGQEDASRVDWIAAVKKARTVSKMASLVAAFSAKVSERLEKMELELQHLNDAIEAWERAARRKTPSNDSHPEPTEVWADVTFTDDFCLAKSEAFVWWPARICVAKNKDLAESLSTLGRTLVSLVGEAGDLRVVKTDDTVPFSETPPENEALTHLTKDGRAQLDDCMTMAKRIIRGQEKKASRGRKKPKVVPPAENGEFKEEKKLAS